jgi:hypothetical protein
MIGRRVAVAAFMVEDETHGSGRERAGAKAESVSAADA